MNRAVVVSRFVVDLIGVIGVWVTSYSFIVTCNEQFGGNPFRAETAPAEAL